MATTNCAFNTATALRRVFMPSNLGASDCLHVTRIFVPALLALSSQQAYTYSTWGDKPTKPGTWGSASAPAFYNHYRELAKPDARLPSATRRRPREFQDENTPGPRVKTKLARLPRDEELRPPYTYIAKVDEDGEEYLTDLQEVKKVLARLDRKTESLQAIRMPNPEDPSAPKWPICKIVNKKEELARQKFDKEQARKQKIAAKAKEMEINWAVAPHDLEHKLRTLQKFLAKGYKVQMLLLKKRGSKVKVQEKEAKALLDKILETVAEVPGAKEWKKREGQVLGSLKIFLQGKLQEKEMAAQPSEEDAEELSG